MDLKILLALLFVLAPVSACFSLRDLSSVEVETPVNVGRLMSANNVNVGVVGSFRNPIDPNVAVVFNEDGFRLIFPTTDAQFFTCSAKEKYIFVKENCSTGESTSEVGRRIYYMGDDFTFEAFQPPCNESKCPWILSMDYLEFPREYLIRCWNNVVWSCKLVNKNVVLGYGENDVKRIVNETLRFMVENRVVNLDKQDINAITAVARLGYSGHNNRLVKSKEGWMPYYQTENPVIIRQMTVGGCGKGEVVEGVPSEVISFGPSKVNPAENPFAVFFRNFLKFLGFDLEKL